VDTNRSHTAPCCRCSVPRSSSLATPPATRVDLLNDLSALRKQADYGYEPIDEEVEALLDRVEAFVADMGGLVAERG